MLPKSTVTFTAFVVIEILVSVRGETVNHNLRNILFREYKTSLPHDESREMRSGFVLQNSNKGEYDATSSDSHLVSRFKLSSSGNERERTSAISHKNVVSSPVTDALDAVTVTKGWNKNPTGWLAFDHNASKSTTLNNGDIEPDSEIDSNTECDQETAPHGDSEIEEMEDPTSVLLSDLDTIKHAEMKKWNEPPISYYKCDSCKCFHLGNASAVHANCERLNLREFPRFLPSSISALNLRNNDVMLKFDQLLQYTSLSKLILASNKITEILNTSCGEHLKIRVLDLSDNRIRRISDSGLSCLPYLENLYLQSNNIQIITNGMFNGLVRLQHLELSGNMLASIEDTAFRACRNLRFLDLSDNKNMSYSKKTLSPKIFEPLKQLETLHIQRFGKRSNVYPIAALLKLGNLRALNIDGVSQGVFDPSLKALKNLSSLKIAVAGYCAIKHINETFFSGFPYLKSIHIDRCGPKSISPSAFRATTLLEDLIYSNMTVDFDDLFSTLSALGNSSLKSLTITNIFWRHGKGIACRSLDLTQAQYLKNMSHLTHLNLDNNLISLITYHFLANLPTSIERLSFRQNTLHYKRSAIRSPAMLQLNNLVEVREDLQNRVSFFHDIKDDLDEPEDKRCSAELKTKPSVATSMKSGMYSTKNQQINDSGVSTTSLHSSFRFYSASQSFNFGAQMLTSTLAYQNVTSLNLSNTFITNWGRKTLNSRIQIADFSDNFCDYLSSGFFRVNNSITELHLGGNFLGGVFASDHKGEILSRLGKAAYIDLSRNHIQDLPPKFFNGLVNVQVINLSNNKLWCFNVSLSHMSSLTFINLNQNSISTISKQTRDDLDLLNTYNQVSIDLTSNPLACSCQGIDMLQWLVTTKVRLISEDFLQCEAENGKLVLAGDLNERFQTLQKACVSRAFLIVIISFSIILVLLVALAVWMFRNRWKLYYLKNLAIAKMVGQENVLKEGEKYCFDAYMLYSKHDAGFVMKECLKELEDKRGHRVCVEHRDFVLGSYMPLTITNAINRCRVTIPVISPEFWDGDWCEYGVQMAVMESVHDKRNVLHLFIYKPVPLDKMPRNLLKVLKENNFCEYPPAGCDEIVRDAFWDTLSRAIGHVKIKEEEYNN